MKKIFILVLLFISHFTFGKGSPTEQAAAIVAEGKLLYKSEMASWYGTDLFLSIYRDKENVGGYFSYPDNNIAKCVFYSKSDTPIALGTISFDSTYNTETANIDIIPRNLSRKELDIYTLRLIALKEMKSDKMFKTYPRTSLNIIPLINGAEKKVYVLTGPQDAGVVIFGNDYLLTFDKNNRLLTKKQLHKNIIPIYNDVENKNAEPVVTTHNHLAETGEFITATDICTLMLYAKFGNWKTHVVMSKKYYNNWDCKKNELNVIPMDVIKKINKQSMKEEKK